VTGSVDVSKLQLIKATPPARYASSRGEVNPFGQVVADAPDQVWQCYVGLSTKKDQIRKDHRTGDDIKVSQLDQVVRGLRSAVRRAGLGVDTNQQPGTKPGTVDLFWQKRPRRQRRTTTTEVEQ
jgi:hypothetical protein